MTTDRQLNALSGASPSAAASFDEAVRSFNIYRGDPLARLDEAVADSPAFAQAHLFKAFILALATEPAATMQARDIADVVRGLTLNEREQSQLAALDQLIAGNWVSAAGAMDFHNMRFPRDLVGLQVGHLMDFYRGSARDLRDRIARALPALARRPARATTPCSACTPSGSRKPATTPAPRPRVGAPSISSRWMRGRTMPSPMSWRCRAAPRMASAG